MRVEPNKTYVTVGEYVVVLNNDRNATVETSPGLSSDGKGVKEDLLQDMGWYFSENGKPFLNEEWTKKLTIVEELPFELPKLHQGYKWAGGYPQFRVPKIGEWYFSYTKYSDNSFINRCDNLNETKGGMFSGRRLILEKVNTQQVSAKESTMKPPVNSNIVEATPQEEYPQYYASDSPDTYAFKKVIYKDNYILVDLDGTERTTIHRLSYSHKTYKITKEEALSRIKPIPNLIPNEYKTGLVVRDASPFGYEFVVKTTKQPQSRVKSALNYFVGEPVKNTGVAVKKSFRYVLLYSVVSVVGYTAYNPTAVVKFMKSCLPKISIKVE